MRASRFHLPVTLDAVHAKGFCSIALANIEREFPNKLDHVLSGPADAATPRALHPAFFGSFDWHSCVHMHWLLAHCRRLHPDLLLRAEIDAAFARHLTRQTIASELAYLRRPEAETFERTYGWAWLLKLADELLRSDDDASRRDYRVLAPLASEFVGRYIHYLPRLRYPLRHGMHANSAFALLFALDYARRVKDEALEVLCTRKARDWYLNDIGAPASFEPSGADFLSPTLIEAALMRRVLPPERFDSWFTAFLPDLWRGEPRALLHPVEVSDRSDGHIVHLDGLNLSRAWCWRAIASALSPDDPRVSLARAAVAAHIAAGLVGLSSANYVGEHWLATFAALAFSD
jgi:hypothetical protein